MIPRRARTALAALAAAALIGTACIGTAGARPAETGDPAFGRWVVDDGKAVIEVYPCGDEACGRIVWLEKAYGPDGEVKRDLNNPDPEKQARPLCRLRLITGLAPVEPGVWTGGEIYSTRDGATYGFEIEGVEGDRMTVRGYLGVPLLGRSRVWTRDDGMRGSCTAFGPPGRSQ